MHKNFKPYIIVVLLSATLIFCFTFPKVKNISTDIFSQLEIPYELKNWQGIKNDQEWNLEVEKDNYNNQTFKREYVNMNGKNLFLVILNSGTFHNPKVCSHGSGYEVKELNDTEFQIFNRTIKAHTLYTKKNAEGFLLIYWICCDKNIVDWTGQKIKELWYSLINKDRTNLMIRLDIPAKDEDIDDALKLAKEFITDFGQVLTSEDAGYIFGS